MARRRKAAKRMRQALEAPLMRLGLAAVPGRGGGAARGSAG